jgi:DNA-binding SARP family transcriptional activator
LKGGSLRPDRQRPVAAPGLSPTGGSSELDCQDLLSLTPFGILVFDRSGRLIAHNPASERLLGGLLADAATSTRRCCELLGCRRPGSPLEGSCILELARTQDGPLPEIRVDLAADHEPSALWITLTPIGPGSSKVLVALRPGERGDRRRRTVPHWISEPRLSVSVLGRTALASAETPLEGQWLQQRPGRLLKYLLAHRSRLVPTDELADAFWPDGGQAGLANVRYFIHVLRGQLEPGRARRAPSRFIIAENGGYRLDRSRVHIDADRFESLASSGLAAAARGDPVAASLLIEAVELYEGDFLSEEPYAEWALSERDRLRTLVAEALRTLAWIAASTKHPHAAADHLRRLATLEPFDVQVQRELLYLYMRHGRHSQAKRLYSSLKARMREHFGEELDFTLTELAERTRRDAA